MDIRIRDEALFVVPGSGALWSYDFGSEKRVIREAHDEASDPPFQAAQARAGEVELLLVFPTLGRPSIDPVLMIRMLIVGYCLAIRSGADCVPIIDPPSSQITRKTESRLRAASKPD